MKNEDNKIIFMFLSCYLVILTPDKITRKEKENESQERKYKRNTRLVFVVIDIPSLVYTSQVILVIIIIIIISQ